VGAEDGDRREPPAGSAGRRLALELLRREDWHNSRPAVLAGGLTYSYSPVGVDRTEPSTEGYGRCPRSSTRRPRVSIRCMASALVRKLHVFTYFRDRGPAFSPTIHQV